MNQRTVYVILTPGRSGSHIIMESLIKRRRSGDQSVPAPSGLANAIGVWYPDIKDLVLSKHNLVIHSHYVGVAAKLGLDPTEVILILSYRRDIFAQVMSHLVAEITGEYGGDSYTCKPVHLEYCKPEKFVSCLTRILKFPSTVNINVSYKKIITIYYEDILQFGPEHIASVLDLPYDHRLVDIRRKSPYDYKKIISNHESLYQLFLQIMSKHQIK